MSTTAPSTPRITPDAAIGMDADAFRSLGHSLVDRIADELAAMPTGPLTPGEQPSVVRRALDRHGLVGPYADVEDLETAVRVTPDGRRIRFLLNHRASPVTVTLHCGGTGLLTDDKLPTGSTVDLPPYAILVLAEDSHDHVRSTPDTYTERP